MAKYYSPTRTMDYMNCPALIPLKRTWQPKPTAWTPNMLLGKAVARGLECHYRSYLGCTVDPVCEMNLVLEAEYVEQPAWTLDGLYKLASVGLKAGIASGFPLGGTILSVEEEMGGFRPDLVYRSSNGEIVVVDNKVTLALKPDYVQMRLAEYESSWQFAHYAWAAGERYGEPVNKVAAHLIVLTPRPKAYIHVVEFTPERLDMWLRDASIVWLDMAEDELIMENSETNLYRRNWNYCQRYGSQHRCMYYQLCHELAGDESRAELFYDRIESEGSSEL